MTQSSDDPTIPATNPRGAGTQSVEHPEWIGPYRVLQVLGDGGMGIVYEADQMEPVRRRVAIKVLKLGMDTREFVARFESERQALAVMDHPNIARVLDAGATDTGRPYFVMEKVDGIPITLFCDAQKLTTRSRLELFIPVCQAAQHAHQKGVIHRDLKPSNILVALHEEKPVPKIIDFGVAKAINWRLSDRTQVTQLGQPIGTPAYMSPEQWGTSGLDVDTRTDVYSLGVVLYELLVGRLPVDPQLLSRAGEAAGFVLHESPPPTPSRRILSLRQSLEVIAALRNTDPANLGKELRGDLDWIVTKAMEADRTRRYETADGLAADIRRHLANEPVVARPPTTAYRAGRFIRRHRSGVIISGAIAALVLAFAAATARQASLIARERDRVRLEATKAEQVSGFLKELFAVSDPGESLGNSITAREILDRGAERIETDLAGQPEVQVSLMAVMGDVYNNLGLYDRAGELADSWLAVARNTYGESHATVADALASKATVLRVRGALVESEALYREAYAMRRSLFGDEHPDVATSLNGLGVLLGAMGKNEEAAEMLTDALAIRQRFFPAVSEAVSETLNNLATVTEESGDLDSAEVLYRESLRLRRDLYGNAHPRVATAMNNLGLFLRGRGDLEGAEPLLREALTVRRAVLGNEHQAVASTINNLAGLLRMQGDLDAAEPLYYESLELRRRLNGDTHPSVATALNNLGRFLESKGDREGSERVLRESLDVARVAYPDGHPNIAAVLRNLGNLIVRRDNPRGAEPILRESLAMFRSALGPVNRRTLQAQSDLGACLIELDRFDEAERLLLESHEALVAEARDNDSDVTRSAERLGTLYERWGKPELAARYRLAVS